MREGSGAWGWSAAQLCGEIQNSGPGFSLWGSLGDKALNCRGPVPMGFGSKSRNDWQGTARIDGSHGAKHSKDSGFGCKPLLGAVWQGLNAAGSTKATSEPSHMSPGL